MIEWKDFIYKGTFSIKIPARDHVEAESILEKRMVELEGYGIELEQPRLDVVEYNVDGN